MKQKSTFVHFSSLSKRELFDEKETGDQRNSSISQIILKDR
jgi:hypothetical protein